MDGQQKEVFPFGDGTIMQLREQALELEDFGTRVLSSAAMPAAVVTEPPPMIGVAAEPASALEAKVDLLLQAVAAMQRRLDSIDQAIARVLSR